MSFKLLKWHIFCNLLRKHLTMKKIFYLLPICIMIFACNGTAKKVAETSDNTKEALNMNETKKMMADGYLAGTIVFGKESGDCEVMIYVENQDRKYYLDPIDLDSSFSKENMKIWFKYRPLRMANRCVKANPISMEDTKRREE